jgi:hypothetical protein
MTGGAGGPGQPRSSVEQVGVFLRASAEVPAIAALVRRREAAGLARRLAELDSTEPTGGLAVAERLAVLDRDASILADGQMLGVLWADAARRAFRTESSLRLVRAHLTAAALLQADRLHRPRFIARSKEFTTDAVRLAAALAKKDPIGITDLAAELASSGQLSAAVDLVDALPDIQSKFWGHLRVAEAGARVDPVSAADALDRGSELEQEFRFVHRDVDQHEQWAFAAAAVRQQLGDEIGAAKLDEWVAGGWDGGRNGGRDEKNNPVAQPLWWESKYSSLAGALAKAGRIEAAGQVVAAVGPKYRLLAVRELASAHGRAGDLSAARRATELLDSSERQHALRDAAVALARRGDSAAAKAVADDLPDNPDRWYVSAALARMSAEAGDFSATRRHLGSIPDPSKLWSDQAVQDYNRAHLKLTAASFIRNPSLPAQVPVLLELSGRRPAPTGDAHRQFAAELTAAGDTATVCRWLAGLKDGDFKAAAYLGAAEGILARTVQNRPAPLREPRMVEARWWQARDWVNFGITGRYTGPWLFRPHGSGVFEGNDGWTYRGQFRNGKRHGYGVMTHKPASEGEPPDLYQGEFKDDQFVSGTCSLLCHPRALPFAVVKVGYDGRYQGAVVTNSWENAALPHGRGSFKTENGRTFEGEWSRGAFVSGRVSYLNGAVLEGRFEQKVSGGKAILAEGRTISLKGSAWGLEAGQYQNCDYTGQVRAGVYHGQGSLRGVSGDLTRFDGEFRDGKPWNGVGKLRWASGLYDGKTYAVYSEGDFREGELYSGERTGNPQVVFVIREGKLVGKRQPGTVDVYPIYPGQ